MHTLTFALAQLNLTVGAIQANTQQILDAALRAAKQKAHVLVTPELSLTGYPPEDLLLRPSFLSFVTTQLEHLCQATCDLDLYIVVGHPTVNHQSHLLFNSVSVLYRGKIVVQYHKQILPNDQVFDEKRYFCEGRQACVFEVGQTKIGILICEDAWHAKPAQDAKNLGADILLVVNASPFHVNKTQQRLEVMRQRVAQTDCALIYANLVGAQDELVFDGASFVLNHQGACVYQLPACDSLLSFIDYQPNINRWTTTALQAQNDCVEAQVYRALVLGVRDYVHKNRFPGAIIGLSGGVDSALVLCIAVDALGAENVRAVMLQSPYTADISWIDACQLAKNLNVDYQEIPIADCMQAFEQTLATKLRHFSGDTTPENIQARIRGTILMALSNNTGKIVLTTGNKSEMATGYCTLYGDMAGGFAVIKDVLKTLVYRICHWRNQHVSPDIPMRILTRAPSAELRPDQTDQDSLPPYEILDDIIVRYMENNQSIDEMKDAGLPLDAIRQVVRLIRINEYKRRQAPIGIRISARGFGRDWRYPIINQFVD